MSRRHAIVIGAGMAGLLAARVLADTFERVTVFDADSLPAGPLHRAGVPQSHQVHVLMPGGSAVLEDLFPGFKNELYSAGVPHSDMLGSCRTYINGAALKKRHIWLDCLPVSRPFAEHVVR